MKCAIPTIADADLDISVSAAIGVETILKYSNDPVYIVGELTQDAVDTGTLTPDRAYPPLTAGRDLQFTCLEAVESSTAIVAALGVTFGDGTTGSGVATIAPRSTVTDQSFNFPPGIAVDVKLYKAGVDVTNTLKVRSVDSLIGITGGAVGNKFEILACPEAASYTTIACITNRDIEVPTSKSIAIECGYDGARWVKKGRSTPPKADFKANYTGYGQGLPRINARRVTVMLETRKNDKVLTERMIIGGYTPEVKIAIPDGDAKSEATATGMFESGRFAVFV